MKEDDFKEIKELLFKVSSIFAPSCEASNVKFFIALSDDDDIVSMGNMEEKDLLDLLWAATEEFKNKEVDYGDTPIH